MFGREVTTNTALSTIAREAQLAGAKQERLNIAILACLLLQDYLGLRQALRDLIFLARIPNEVLIQAKLSKNEIQIAQTL
jgi:hypothetical protein